MNPWLDIPQSSSQQHYLTQLVNPDHPFDFYWGRDFEGQFIFRFMGDFPEEVTDSAPEMTGLKLLGGEESGRSHLTLILESTEDAGIFYYLCTSLMDSTQKIAPGEDLAAARIVLTQLGRWQKLLKNRGSKLLNLQQQMGLFGELLVLRDIFLKNIPAREAVCCWSGPLGDEQDFGYGNSLVEVKTTRSTKDQEIKISSFAQLDTVSGEINLIVQTVGVFEDQPPKSLSLNGLVSELYKLLLSESNEVVEQLGMRLAMVGYEMDPAYDKYYFVPVSRKMFAVEGDFPRLGSADIRTGISKGSYSILLESCLPFEMNNETALDRILKGVENTTLESVKPELATLIKLDESRSLEFKSTLRYCLRTKEPQKYIEDAIVKSVAALTNTIGGKLIIGFNEKMGVYGLADDYSTLKQKNRDGFELHFSTLLINAFGEAYMAGHVTTQFESFEGKELYIVNIKRSESLKFVEHSLKSGEKRQILYSRFPNSSREIPADQLQEYIQNRPY